VTHNPWPESSATTTRTLTFSPQVMGPTAIQGPFLINMMPFDMMMINFYIPFEATEIWTLTNSTPIAHPFHIHNVPFYILDINGQVPPASLQGRKDVVLVPAGGGTVRFITKFEDFYNDSVPYMYHCHMLTHEDDGMMGQFIVNSPPDAGLNESSVDDEIVIYPNPANDVVTITISHTSSNIKLMDQTGRVIFTKKSTQKKTELNISELPNGTYSILVQNDTKVYSNKLVVVR
jgi:bilirubin oxidase